MSEWASVCAVSLSVGLLLLAAYFSYAGLFAQITVFAGQPPIKKVTFVYKLEEGAYKNCGGVFKEAKSIGPALSYMGIFYDDPKKVPGPQCRCAVGSIVSEGEDKADEELLKRYETSGFRVFSIPEVTHVVTTSFPHRSFLSVLLGVKRVYPKLESYIKERKLCAHPFLEIYRGGLIYFMAPLARQGDFYVPEVRSAKRRLLEQGELDSDTDISGADSNSEYSSGSGVPLSDSRETSPASSSVRSVQDHEDSSPRGGCFLRELDWEQTDQEEERPERFIKDESQKSLEVPGPNMWGVVGGEE